MKNKVLSAVVTATVLGMTPAAFAGEGGIAGAAAFRIDPSNGAVVDVAVASAIGKTSAVAGAAFQERTGNFEAFALGTGAELDVDGVTGLEVDAFEESNRGLATPQANNISALAIGPVQLTPNPILGGPILPVPPAPGT